MVANICNPCGKLDLPSQTLDRATPHPPMQGAESKAKAAPALMPHPIYPPSSAPTAVPHGVIRLQCGAALEKGRIALNCHVCVAGATRGAIAKPILSRGGAASLTRAEQSDYL